MMRIRKPLIVVAAVTLVSVVFLAGWQVGKKGVANPPGAPGATLSYTLEDIYNRLASGGGATTPSPFTEPTAVPGAGTMYTLDAIMGEAPVRKDATGATTADVVANKDFWGLTGGQWGMRAGTAVERDDLSGPDGSRWFSILDGFYSGKTATANDGNLKADNIKDGETIFDVTGTYTGPPRFIDNGDNTVTDLQTQLMWTKSANDAGGTKNWYEALDYCAGLGVAGHSDWRLPELWALFSLIDKRQANPALPAGHPFTGVEVGGWKHYWSSTRDRSMWDAAFVVYMSVGFVGGWSMPSPNTGWVWPVRGP